MIRVGCCVSLKNNILKTRVTSCQFVFEMKGDLISSNLRGLARSEGDEGKTRGEPGEGQEEDKAKTRGGQGEDKE